MTVPLFQTFPAIVLSILQMSMKNSDRTSTILFVETFSGHIQPLKNPLARQGMTLSAVQSGQELLNALEREAPDLLLLEPKLPDMDGFIVCQDITRHPKTRDISVIFIMPPHANPEYVAKAFEAGAVDCISAPLHIGESFARIFTHLKLKSAHQSLIKQNQQLVEQNSLLQERYALKKQDFSGTLEDSEERFRSTFEQAAVGIAHAAMDGRFLRINQRFCDIVNYTPQEIQTYTFQEITFPEDLDSDLLLVQQLLAGARQTYSMEKRYIRKDGTLVWVNLTVSLARDVSGAPKYFIKVVEDISQRKQAEKALRTSEQQYRLLAERVSDGIGIIQDGKLVFVNAALAAMLEVSSDELIGRSPAELFHTPDNVPAKSEAEHEAPGPRSQPVLHYVITREQHKVWLEGRQSVFTWQGRPAVLIDLRDITERKLRERAMTEERDILRQEKYPSAGLHAGTLSIRRNYRQKPGHAEGSSVAPFVYALF